MKKIMTVVAFAITITMSISSCGCKEENLGDDYILGQDDQYYFRPIGPCSFAESADYYYFIGGSYLMSKNKETGEMTPVCNKPDCLHDEEPDSSRVANCNAHIGSDMLINYYDGKLYFLAEDFENLGVSEQIIYEMDVSGTTRKELFRPKEFVCDMMVHRGYLYVAYLAQQGDQRYYEEHPEKLENLRYWVERYDLERMSKKPTVLYEKKGVFGNVHHLWAYGNVIYMEESTDTEDKVILYNIQEKTTKELKKTYSAKTVVNHRLVYFEASENINSISYEEMHKQMEKTKAVSMDIYGEDRSELSIPFIQKVRSNGSILALDNENEVRWDYIPREKRSVQFYDGEGKFLTEVILGDEAVVGIGMNEDYYFYYHNSDKENGGRDIWAIDLQRLGDPELEGEPFICYREPVPYQGVTTSY